MSSEHSQQEFRWSVHPARQRPWAAVSAGVVIIAAAAVLWTSFGAGWAVFAVVVLVLALHSFFFASAFQMDADGLVARSLMGTRRIRWVDVRRFVHDERGGFLSTRAVRSRLDAFAGMHFLFGAHRDEIIRRIRAHRAAASAAREIAQAEAAHG